MTDANAWSSPIESVLAAGGAAVTRVTPVVWECGGHDDGAVRVSVRLAGEWLLFDAPADGACAADEGGVNPHWDLLAANARLPLGVKFALAAGEPSLRVRAEMPVVADRDLDARVAALWATIVNPLRADHIGRNPSPAPFPRDSAGRGDLRSLGVEQGLDPEGRGGGAACGVPAHELDLAALCAAARWPFNAREDGTLAVPLEVAPVFQQATVAVDAADGVVGRTPILEGDAPGPGVCRDALGLLLLRACGVFRMVRAAVDAASGAVRFEVVLGAQPTSDELARALSALSVAWRLAAREARVLASDAHIAEAFLAGRAGAGGCRP